FDRAIKIVVVTGSPDPELARQARALGAVAVLAKPLSTPDLFAALRAGTVPPTPAGSAAQAPLPEARRAVAHASPTPEVLVVVAEPQLRARLGELLTARGHAVRLRGAAGGGVRALDAAAQVRCRDRRRARSRGRRGRGRRVSAASRRTA